MSIEHIKDSPNNIYYGDMSIDSKKILNKIKDLKRTPISTTLDTYTYNEFRKLVGKEKIGRVFDELMLEFINDVKKKQTKKGKK